MSNTVSSGDRLSFTIFLAAALHAMLIFGISFTVSGDRKVAPTLNVTLATHKSTTAPEKADFLAQHNQEASGTEETPKELTAKETADIAAPNVHQINPVPQQKTTTASKNSEQFVTTTADRSFQVTQPQDSEQSEDREERQAEQEDAPAVNPEIASLRAKLDKLQQEYAKRPRIRRMTSVATKSSHDAEYLNAWTEKIESVGNQNFPEAALQNRIFGTLRLSAVINANGTIDRVEILDSSGHAILDRAAVQIVHRAGPFAPFPPEIRENADKLDIIRTWQFEITGLKTGATSE